MLIFSIISLGENKNGEATAGETNCGPMDKSDNMAGKCTILSYEHCASERCTRDSPKLTALRARQSVHCHLLGMAKVEFVALVDKQQCPGLAQSGTPERHNGAHLMARCV